MSVGEGGKEVENGGGSGHASLPPALNPQSCGKITVVGLRVPTILTGQLSLIDSGGGSLSANRPWNSVNLTGNAKEKKEVYIDRGRRPPRAMRALRCSLCAK